MKYENKKNIVLITFGILLSITSFIVYGIIKENENNIVHIDENELCDRIEEVVRKNGYTRSFKSCRILKQVKDKKGNLNYINAEFILEEEGYPYAYYNSYRWQYLDTLYYARIVKSQENYEVFYSKKD